MPTAPHQPSSCLPPPSTSPSWSPSDHDQLLYQWVKLEGRSQREAAALLGISQATVCRILQRYERWQAHAADREGGRLDHSERLRAQRWQTYDRNEILLSSCLRIAQEMEGFTDVSKSTIQRSSYGGDEQHIRTQHSTIDRTSAVARFLRLAFRINMEQLKLVSLDPPPPAKPLTPAELAELNRQALEIAAELAAKNHQAAPTASPTPEDSASAGDVIADGWAQPTESAPPPIPLSTPAPTPAAFEPALPPTTPLPSTAPPATPIHPLNQMNQTEAPQFTPTPEPTTTCNSATSTAKKSQPCIKPPAGSSSIPQPHIPLPVSPSTTPYPTALSTA